MLDVKDIRYMPGEHDASFDNGLTGHIAHHSAKSLMMAVPPSPPGAGLKPKPLARTPEHPYNGLGFSNVHNFTRKHRFDLSEYEIKKDLNA